jgi:hypothetical protein
MITDKTPDYLRFFVSEIIALIQLKYKIDVSPIVFESKNEYTILKPRKFDFQLYSLSQVNTYNVVFVIEFAYIKIIRKLY